jgi:WD40 repeat protein
VGLRISLFPRRASRGSPAALSPSHASLDNSLQVTVSDDGQCMRLGLASTGDESLVLGPFNEGLHSFEFSEDGLLLLICCGDGSCHIFCARSAVLFMSIRCPLGVQHSSSLGSSLVSAHASFSPDCSQVVFLPGGSCSVYLHSLHTSRLQSPNAVTQKSVQCSSRVFRPWFFLPSSICRHASSSVKRK